ncbi:MAG: hypothetical protein QOK19_1335 [Solirubrobacteraceae bacterium]|jgi:hypothetical protein|nr:hypothetical protein [Solirubrobacterales bacterium]MEA2215774.1 hypothetical protein [Solirubrobacteraceae bacterium]
MFQKQVDAISPAEVRPQAGAAESGRGPSIDLTESGPPATVLEEMARADETNARLREIGCQLVFALSADGCSLQIELRDMDGNLLRLLSATEVERIARRGEVPE